MQAMSEEWDTRANEARNKGDESWKSWGRGKLVWRLRVAPQRKKKNIIDAARLYAAITKWIIRGLNHLDYVNADWFVSRALL